MTLLQHNTPTLQQSHNTTPPRYNSHTTTQHNTTPPCYNSHNTIPPHNTTQYHTTTTATTPAGALGRRKAHTNIEERVYLSPKDVSNGAIFPREEPGRLVYSQKVGRGSKVISRTHTGLYIICICMYVCMNEFR